MISSVDPTERRIRLALDRDEKTTSRLAGEARCSLGTAVVILMRLERDGFAERGPRWSSGMTWRGTR